jgi:hypothetical protein
MKKIFSQEIKYKVSIERSFIDEHLEFCETLYDSIEKALLSQNKKMIEAQFLETGLDFKLGLLSELVKFYGQKPKKTSNFYDYLTNEIAHTKAEETLLVKSKIICQKIKQRSKELNWTKKDLQKRLDWSDRTMGLIEEEKMYFTTGSLYKLREIFNEDYSVIWD